MSSNVDLIKYDELAPYLTGVCRIIYFTNGATSDKNIQIMSVMEGKIKDGYFDGYARQLESGLSWPKSQEVKPNTSCKVGFWKKLDLKLGK